MWSAAMRNLSVALLLLVLFGCAGNRLVPRAGTPPVDPNLHAIYIDQHGELKEKEGAPPPPPDRENIAVAASLAQNEDLYNARIIANFKKEQASRRGLALTIFVHGGLNRSDSSWKRAAAFSADMLREGQYGLFVGWNSGGFTNYFDHLFRIRTGEYKPAQAVLTSPIVAIGDAARSIVNIPTAWYRTVADPLSVTGWYTRTVEVEYARRIGVLGHLKINVSNKPPYTGVGSDYWTILNPVKLLTAPIVDGFGTGSWDSLLRRTDLVLSKPIAYEGRQPKRSWDEDEARALLAASQAGVPAVFTPETKELSDTAVTRFLKDWINDDSLRGVRINLIGHSMGAIVVNNILARHPALSIDNVVFMGGAVRIKDVENGVVPWMRRPGNDLSRFYNLSLDPYREIGENEFYDFVPRGSLLHWIDNIFGQVNSFKDRTAGGWWNIVRTAEDVFPEPVRTRVWLTRFPIGGPEMGPQEHGGFDAYCFWRPSYWQAHTPLLRYPDCAAGTMPPATPQ
jgi:pimeloyl-ACP methyl ester carboxylesterase